MKMTAYVAMVVSFQQHSSECNLQVYRLCKLALCSQRLLFHKSNVLKQCVHLQATAVCFALALARTVLATPWPYINSSQLQLLTTCIRMEQFGFGMSTATRKLPEMSTIFPNILNLLRFTDVTQQSLFLWAFSLASYT